VSGAAGGYKSFRCTFISLPLHRHGSHTVDGVPAHFSDCPGNSPRGVATAVPPARHGRLHAKLRHKLLIVVCAILAASVGLVNQSWRWALVAHSVPKGLCGQILRHACVYRIAYQLAGEDVFDAGQVEPSFASPAKKPLRETSIARYREFTGYSSHNSS
jgi:hypothetical protein